jgi:hypothetical protein
LGGTARLPKSYYFGSFLFAASIGSIGYKTAYFFGSLIYSVQVHGTLCREAGEKVMGDIGRRDRPAAYQ